MITFRRQAYFDKYLGIINEKSRTLKKYDYYIKIPAKYDLKYWLLAALKKKLFDVETPKVYHNIKNNEASEAEVQKMKFSKNIGGILIFANDLDITKRYAENFHEIFTKTLFKNIFKKYPEGILWYFGRRYRGVYSNKPRNKTFNASSNTLEILGLNSIDLINVGVKLAVQFQQPIILIKDFNNETMIILGKNIAEKKISTADIDFGVSDEISDFDIMKLKTELNETYKLCPSYMHTLWEMSDVYPKLNYFWVEYGTWFGK